MKTESCHMIFRNSNANKAQHKPSEQPTQKNCIHTGCARSRSFSFSSSRSFASLFSTVLHLSPFLFVYFSFYFPFYSFLALFSFPRSYVCYLLQCAVCHRLRCISFRRCKAEMQFSMMPKRIILFVNRIIRFAFIVIFLMCTQT